MLTLLAYRSFYLNTTTIDDEEEDGNRQAKAEFFVHDYRTGERECFVAEEEEGASEREKKSRND